MRMFVALASVAAATLALVEPVLANREPEPFSVKVDGQSLDETDYEGYRPTWANPYADPSGFGVNDYPTPFYPSDVDSGPDPLEPDGY
jgi:hypothetical protein